MIPFNKPSIVGNELKYIQDAVRQGVISADGKYTKLCEAFLEERYNVPKVLLTTSCTDALEMAALLLGIQPGDEVIVPSFTYVSTANAFALRGAKLTFVDCNTDTFNISVSDLSGKITSKTKALVIMHYAGVACEMDEIMRLCSEHNVKLIEDAALGLEAIYKGKPLGTFGDLSTFSFHETKNVSAGEGGALFINDEKLIDAAYICRDKGTNRQQFKESLSDKYVWQAKGSSFGPSELNAAVLYGQLEKLDLIHATRKQLWQTYYDAFQDIENVQLPVIPINTSKNGAVFHLLLENEKQRDDFISFMKKEGIKVVFHYQPLHKSPYAIKEIEPQYLPISESIANRLVRLPLFYSLTDEEQMQIICAVRKFFC